MKIKRFVLSPLDTNCYLLYKEKKGIVIDPGGDISELLSFIDTYNIEIKYILNTHLHFDHTLSNKLLKDKTGAKILANSKDRYLLDMDLGQGGMLDLPRVEPFDFDELSEGNRIFLEEKCIIISTPGHTPGSLSFYFPSKKVIFVGDLIFYHSIGRTDFPGGDFEAIARSIKEKIYLLSDNVIIYPGHGAYTTIKEEKLHNPFIRG